MHLWITIIVARYKGNAKFHDLGSFKPGTSSHILQASQKRDTQPVGSESATAALALRDATTA